MTSFQTIAQEKKLPVPSTQYPELLILLGTGYCYRHRSTASHHSVFAHSSKVAFAHSRCVHQASPNCAGLRAAAALNWYGARPDPVRPVSVPARTAGAWTAGPAVIGAMLRDPPAAAAGAAFLRTAAPALALLAVTITANAYWIGSGRPTVS